VEAYHLVEGAGIMAAAGGMEEEAGQNKTSLIWD